MKNKFYGAILSLAMGATAAAETGCAESIHCKMKGGEEKVYSYFELQNKCAQNKALVFKCIIEGSSVSDDPYIDQFSCSSNTLAEQSKGMLGADVAICNGSEIPDKVSAVCQ